MDRARTHNLYMNNFISFVNSCGLINIPAKGNRFTWSNRQDPPNTILERLDRALPNNAAWLAAFPQNKTHSSSHSGI